MIIFLLGLKITHTSAISCFQCQHPEFLKYSVTHIKGTSPLFSCEINIFTNEIISGDAKHVCDWFQGDRHIAAVVVYLLASIR